MRLGEEEKTKPTQHSVGKLREIGIQPDILICRTASRLAEALKKKISLFTNVELTAVVNGLNVESVYEVPLMFHEEGLDQKICEFLQMWTRQPQLDPWKELIDRFKNPKHTVNIAFVGKYVEQKDSYESLNEALVHGGIAHRVQVKVYYVNSEDLTPSTISSVLGLADGILVAPGFGGRGFEGKILAVQYAREQKVPFFGICLGMQSAVIEFARHRVHLEGAHSGEFMPEAKYKVIDLMEGQKGQEGTGGSMRLGAYPALLKENSHIAEIYGTRHIVERHRHRYEMMNEYIPQFEQAGMIISGYYEERHLVETVELPDHPWFIGCQFHPELQSKPFKPHPLFASFIEASYQHHLKS